MLYTRCRHFVQPGAVCGFSGVCKAVAGECPLFGITLSENFKRPYFACSIKEFWRRWHISLSSWLRDYIYIPLGGSRCGRLRRYRNLMVTFLVSGLWHGASWHFVVWGGMHGLFQVIAAQTRKLRDGLYEKYNTKCTSFSFRFGQMAVTFVLTTFAWIFFRAESLTQGCSYIGRIFTKPDWYVLTDGSLYELGLERVEMNMLLVSLLILFVVSFMKYQKKMIVPALALAMLLCGTMTAFAANANPANAENLREEGESAIVWDVTEQPSPENDKNEYWAYDEYKAYAESIERSLMELLATGEPDLTQQDVQACKDTLARTLDFIKNGGHVSKNMVNGDSLLMVSPLDSSLVGSSSEK